MLRRRRDRVQRGGQHTALSVGTPAAAAVEMDAAGAGTSDRASISAVRGGGGGSDDDEPQSPGPHSSMDSPREGHHRAKEEDEDDAAHDTRLAKLMLRQAIILTLTLNPTLT